MSSFYLVDSSYNTIDLQEQEASTVGFQVTAIGGLGLGPVDVQLLDQLDGALYRRTRPLPQDLDFSLNITCSDLADRKARLASLAICLSDQVQIIYLDDDSVGWVAYGYYAGGGTYALGTDQVQGLDINLVVTLRVPEPVFIRTDASSEVITSFGAQSFDVGGDAVTYPVWTVEGPATEVELTSAAGDTVLWTGSLTSSDTLVLFSKSGSVQKNGSNAYSGIAPAPRFWKLNPGTNSVTVAVTGSSGATSVTCAWHERQRMVM